MQANPELKEAADSLLTEARNQIAETMDVA
jgi:hypothetical protein